MRHVPQGRRGREWLDGENVHVGACQRAGAKRIGQRILVDDLSADDVDQPGAGLHGGEPCGIEEAPRLVRQRTGEHDPIGLGQHRAQGVESNDVVEVRGRRGRASHTGDPDIERRQQARDMGADAAHAHDDRALAFQRHGREPTAQGQPAVLALRRDPLRNAACQGQHGGDRGLRHRQRVAARP